MCVDTISVSVCATIMELLKACVHGNSLCQDFYCTILLKGNNYLKSSKTLAYDKYSFIQKKCVKQTSYVKLVVEEPRMQNFEIASPPLHLHKLHIIGKLRCCRSMFEGVWSSTEVPLPWKQRSKIHIWLFCEIACFCVTNLLGMAGYYRNFLLEFFQNCCTANKFVKQKGKICLGR